MARARGLQRKAAVLPTSAASMARGRGELFVVYLIMVSMKPMAVAARDAQGPAEMALTRTAQRRPASNARVRVSASSAALAEDIPPPYPGITRSPAIYVRDRKEPPGRMSGERFRTSEMLLYALMLIAER